MKHELDCSSSSTNPISSGHSGNSNSSSNGNNIIVVHHSSSNSNNSNNNNNNGGNGAASSVLVVQSVASSALNTKTGSLAAGDANLHKNKFNKTVVGTLVVSNSSSGGGGGGHHGDSADGGGGARSSKSLKMSNNANGHHHYGSSNGNGSSSVATGGGGGQPRGSADGHRSEPDSDTIKMFVGQIPRSFDESQLREFFSEYGPVYQLNILRDKVTGQSRGCCFVTFFHRKDAIAAQCALHDVKTMPGMHHPVQMKPADSENRNDRKLFVGMLSKRCTEAEVQAMFSPYGALEDCTILRDANGNSKGCAFVTYASRSCALNATKSMHHSQTMEGCSMPLVVKQADTQKEKEQKKVSQQQQQQVGAAGLLGLSSNQGGAATGMSMSLAQQSPFIQQPAIANQYLNLLQQTGLNQLSVQQQLALLASTAQAGNFGIAPSTANLNSFGQFGTGINSGLSALNFQNLAALTAVNNGSPFGVSNLTNLTGTPAAALFSGKSVATSLNSLSSSGGANFIQLGNSAGGHHHHSAHHLGTPLGATPASLGVATSLGLLPGPSSASAAGLDALSQAYSKIQQYAATLPSLSTSSNVQIQQAVGKQLEGPEGSNLFIYHLPQEFTDSDLAQTFMPFGSVLSAKVFVDKQTNLSKCFGFVSYDNALSSQAAIQAMNGFQIGTKRLKVQLKRSKHDNKPYQHPNNQHNSNSNNSSG